MTALFSSPKMPAAVAPPPTPTVDDTRQAEEDLMRLRKRRGLASTFLFGRSKPGRIASGILGAGASGTTDSAPAAGGSGASGSASPMNR